MLLEIKVEEHHRKDWCPFAVAEARIGSELCPGVSQWSSLARLVEVAALHRYRMGGSLSAAGLNFTACYACDASYKTNRGIFTSAKLTPHDSANV